MLSQFRLKASGLGLKAEDLWPYGREFMSKVRAGSSGFCERAERPGVRVQESRMPLQRLGVYHLWECQTSSPKPSTVQTNMRAYQGVQVIFFSECNAFTGAAHIVGRTQGNKGVHHNGALGL